MKYVMMKFHKLKKLFAHLCLYLHPAAQQSFRVPMLWFIDLIVTTCYVQHTFLSLSHFFHGKTDKTKKILEVRYFHDMKMVTDSY